MAQKPYGRDTDRVKPVPPEPRDDTGAKFWRDRQRAELRRSLGVFTTSETLDALGCSKETLGEYRAKYGLTPLGKGKQRLYEREDVIRALRLAGIDEAKDGEA